MNEIIYRVVIKVGYYEAFFDFDDSAKAGEFASQAVTHAVTNDDNDKPTFIAIRVISKEESDAEE